MAWLQPRHPGVELPAISTAGDLLARRGLVKKRRHRRRDQHPGVVPATTTQPNDLWTADFKGHFRTRDGIYCYPLTIADQHTRYLLACRGLLSTKGHGVRPVFDWLFRESGLPRAIRTDNGVPFATIGLHGLSQLTLLPVYSVTDVPGCSLSFALEGEGTVCPNRCKNGKGKPEQHDDDSSNATSARAIRWLRQSARSAFGHDTARHHLQRQCNSKWQQNDLVQETKNWYEIWYEINRA